MIACRNAENRIIAHLCELSMQLIAQEEIRKITLVPPQSHHCQDPIFVRPGVRHKLACTPGNRKFRHIFKTTTSPHLT